MYSTSNKKKIIKFFNISTGEIKLYTDVPYGSEDDTKCISGDVSEWTTGWNGAENESLGWGVSNFWGT